MNNIVLLSDVHFGVHNNSVIWQDIHRQYFYEFFIPYLKKRKDEGKSDVLFVLGDIFDSRNSINISTLHLATSIFKDISDIVDIYTLVGNHDLYYKDNNEVNSLISLKSYIKQNFIGREYKKFSNIKVLIEAWNSHNSDIDDDTDFIFTHCDLNGMIYDNGMDIEDGVVYPKNFKVISGHIHKTQEKSNMLYTGSPFGMNAGSYKQKFYVYSIDLETKEISKIENTISPKFINMTYDTFNSLSEEEFLKQTKDNFVTIYIPSEAVSIFPYNKVQSMSENMKSLRFKINNSKSDLILEDDFTADNTFDLFTALNSYIDDLNIEDDDKIEIKEKIDNLRNNL